MSGSGNSFIDDNSYLTDDEESFLDSKCNSMQDENNCTKSFTECREPKVVISESDDDIDESFHFTNTGKNKQNLSSILNSDTEDDEICKRKLSKNKNDNLFNSTDLLDSDDDVADKRKENVESFTKTEGIQKHSSSSETDDVENSTFESTSLGQNKKTKKLSFQKARNLATNVSSDSEEDEIICKRKLNKRSPILSDSSDLEKYSSSDNKDDIQSIAEKLNESIISDNFKVDSELINSTPIVGNDVTKPDFRLSLSSKRSLNKSTDTPRTIKQAKESVTPINSENTLKFNASQPKPGPPNFSDDDDGDDIVGVSSDEEVAYVTPKTINKCRTVNISPIDLPSSTKDVGTKMKEVVKSESLPTTDITNTIQNDGSEFKRIDNLKKEAEGSDMIEVSRSEYRLQTNKVQAIDSDLKRAALLLRTINVEHLPDKGKSIRIKHQTLEKTLMDEIKKLSRMIVTNEDHDDPKTKIVSWNQIETGASAVQPRTFGKQALSTYNAQKAVTLERLQQLHGSLSTRPKDNELADNPKGLKIELMDHQKYALSWMMWRENQKPSGGILADDMGLGKTLTMISLVMKTNDIEKNESDNSDAENESIRSNKPIGGTLVVCPASLINQWSSEIERRTKRGLLSCEVYHGPKRENKPKRLAQHDMVITTYSIVNNECEKMGTIFRVKWRRIIIDEAHQIRNYKSQTSVAVCKLSAKSRWALTGTPVQNKELDMYALLKYLRCTPFDDLPVWKRWVTDKSTGGQERLHTVISSLMLRRTKVELIEKGSLQTMPERKWELIPVQLTKPELDIYNRILIFSRKLFAQFLHQRAEKNQDAINLQYETAGQVNDLGNEEYFKMRKKLLNLNKVKDIQQHEILVLLLRLRQICCHPSLITGMLHEDMGDLDGEDLTTGDHAAEFDLLDQLNNLALDDDDEHNPNSSKFIDGGAIGGEAPKLKEAARGLLNPHNPVFSKEMLSSKIKNLLKVLQEKVLVNTDKAIIVSQWSSFLKLIGYHLKQERIRFDQLDGSVPVNKRMEIVDNFNNPDHKMKVLLLSLTAGGVGLNLVGGNHLFLLDLHWNPQLENQAQDRIYRFGQTKSVFIYKFMAEDTIEKRILDLQEKKLEIAKSMLTGTKQVSQNKLSLQDLKMLFEM